MKYKILIVTFLIGSFGFSQTLEQYIETARANNSALKVANYQYDIAAEKVNEVGNLPNTNFSVGYFALQPETRVGAQNTKLGVSQSFPWFGTLSAEKQVAKATAGLQQYNVQLSERAIVFKVKQAYYAIYEQLAQTHILKDNKQILSIYENMALAALENNKASMSDVLRIRVQKNELHSKIFQNINSINRLSKNFNHLLQQDDKTMLNVVDSLNVMDVLITDETIVNHPSLQKMNQLQTVYQTQEKLIQKDRKPKFTVGVDYILVDERKNINLNDNGKDIVMPKIGLSIPIFTKKHQSKLTQIALKEQQLQEELLEQEINLKIALDEATLAFENAVLSVVAAQKNKTEMQQAIDVDLKAYETGILDYDKILRLQLQKIRFELMEVQATKKAFIAKSKIEYLTK